MVLIPADGWILGLEKSQLQHINKQQNRTDHGHDQRPVHQPHNRHRAAAAVVVSAWSVAGVREEERGELPYDRSWRRMLWWASSYGHRRQGGWCHRCRRGCVNGIDDFEEVGGYLDDGGWIAES